jgi:hypothetical protein
VHRQYINYHHSSRQVKVPLPINFQHDSSVVSVFILLCDRNSHPSKSNEAWCNGLRALSSALVISIVLSFVQVTSRNVPLTVFLIMWHDGRRSTTRTMKKLAISGFASQVLLTSRPTGLEVLFSIIPQYKQRRICLQEFSKCYSRQLPCLPVFIIVYLAKQHHEAPCLRWHS